MERINQKEGAMHKGAVAELVGNEGGVVSGVFNLESSGVSAVLADNRLAQAAGWDRELLAIELQENAGKPLRCQRTIVSGLKIVMASRMHG
jgi:hypothetical protein